MDESAVTRKLTTIFYADVAGYSRLMGADEENTHHTVISTLDFVTQSIVDAGGKVLRYAGDAVLAEFTSVVVAVSTSVDIQNELMVRNSDIPEDKNVQIRIGVNLGDVIEDRGEIFGDGVNIAARLESIAEPGNICISGSVYDQIKAKLNINFVSQGNRNLKNISEPVHVYQFTPNQGNQSGEADHLPAPEAAPLKGDVYNWTGLISLIVIIAGIAGLIRAYYWNQ